MRYFLRDTFAKDSHHFVGTSSILESLNIDQTIVDRFSKQIILNGIHNQDGTMFYIAVCSAYQILVHPVSI